MRKYSLLLVAVALLDLPNAHAQLFGRPRNVGRPISSRGGLENQASIGRVTGNERFLRGNRGRAAFVGADRGEAQSFVGSEQARTSGTIVSSTAGITRMQDRSAQINQPLATAPLGTLSLPKIELSFDATAIGTESNARTSVIKRVQRAVSLASPGGISVSVIDRTAILRGLVRSDEQRRLAETMALFEPGISQVQNLVQVEGSTPQESPVPDQPLPIPPRPTL